jgi:hypothetical protein
MDYILAPYIGHDRKVSTLCFGMWVVAAGLPGVWLRQGRQLTQDLIVSSLMLLITTGAWAYRPRYPTSRVLRAYFVSHRTTFDQLAKMACEDMPTDANAFIAGIRGWPQGVTHFPPTRLVAYRRLLHAIDLTPSTVEAQGNVGLLFLAYPILDKGGVGGYAYSCGAPVLEQFVVPSLDVPKRVDQPRYEALAPHWYLLDYVSPSHDVL